MRSYGVNCGVFLTVVTVPGPSASGSDGNAAPWTTEEQKLLEQALKTYPVNTPERWEKIAAAVRGRSKKDCMKRYKVCGCGLFIALESMFDSIEVLVCGRC